MAKEIVSPAYLWYPKDVFSSGRIDELSAAEECWYRRALDRSWMDNGVPADPVKCAAHIGKKCTVKAAEKILAMFFIPMKKDASKMVNLRQEKERTLFNKKRKQKSEAGKRGMRNRWKQSSNSDNSVITENNIPIPISIPISNLDFKRLIETCVREHPAIDPRIVEIGVIHTMLQRNGSTSPINSVRYFDAEIQKAHQGAMGLTAGGKPGKRLSPMTDKAIDTMLNSRRFRIEKTTQPSHLRQ